MIRGVRGATTVPADKEDLVLDATEELLAKIIEANNISPENVSHVIITVTNDLISTFPAKAMRRFSGWKHVPVICSLEIPVPNSLERCVRFLLTVETDKEQQEIQHIYLHDAIRLRPDLHLTSE